VQPVAVEGVQPTYALVVRGGTRLHGGQLLQESDEGLAAGRLAQSGQGFARPGPEGLLQHRQVEQPLTGIVQDLQAQPPGPETRQEAGPVDDELEGGLGEVVRPGRPAWDLGREGGQVAAMAEGRGLAAAGWHEADPAKAGDALSAGALLQKPVQVRQHIQATAEGEEVGDEGGDEDRLAGAREAGHRQAQRGLVQKDVGAGGSVVSGVAETMTEPGQHAGASLG
jgi:hypothetical protein